MNIKKSKRKINYYTIKLADESQAIRSLLIQAIDKINHNNRYSAKARFRSLSSGNILQILKVSNIGAYYSGVAKIVKNVFPELGNKLTGKTKPIEGEENNDLGIPEETHFVLALNEELPDPIIAVESSFDGPRSGDIRIYLSYALRESNPELDLDFIFEPVNTLTLDDLKERIGDISNIHLRVSKLNVYDISQVDQELGDLLDMANSFADYEYIDINFKVNLNKIKDRYRSSNIKERALKFIDLLRNKPNAKEIINKLDIRAEDNENQDYVRFFDLIQLKIASEVTAERRRARSKYYNSSLLNEQIRKQLKLDFQIDDIY